MSFRPGRCDHAVVRATFVLVPAVLLLFLAGEGVRTSGEPRGLAGGARRARGQSEPRLAGRASAGGRPPGEAAEPWPARETGDVRVRLGGPAGRELTVAERRRLLADRDHEDAGDDDLEEALRWAETHLANELSRPCGVLLAGRERGEGPEVDEAPWIDPEVGTFEASFRPPYRVEALYVYGGRILARAPLHDGACKLTVDPERVFAGTGDLELGFVLRETGDTVADLVLDVVAVDRDVSVHAELEGWAHGRAGVRPLRIEDVPAGTYHVRADRLGGPWTVAAATVEVVPGGTTRRILPLVPCASFATRWFRPDGRPTGSRFTTVPVRDAAGRLHEVPARTFPGETHRMLVERCPPGPCWLVTPDRRAHPLNLRAGEPGPEVIVHLQDWSYVIFRVRVEAPPPPALAKRARSTWTVRDHQGVVVETDTTPLTDPDPDGSCWAWAHLTPGRYRVRWVLAPDRVLERDFEVPPGVEEVTIDLGAADD